MQNTNIIIRPVLLTVGILLVPFFGNMYVDGWSWPWTAFTFFGVVLFSADLAYELAGKYAKTGVISGFVFGEMVAGGVIATLRYLNPNDDVAGVVIITFLISGLFFALAGYLIQKHFGKKKN
jgi:apolipoprotein N-acyltransferase